MQHARMDEAQARFKIVRININNLRYSNNNSYGRKWRTKWSLDESERIELKKLAYNSTFTKQQLWQLVPSLHGNHMWKQWKPVIGFTFLGSKIIADGDSAINLKDPCSLEEKL